MEDCLRWPCHACGNVGFSDGFDGFFYCLRCCSKADDVIATGVADEDFVDKGGNGAVYVASLTRHRNSSTIIKAEPLSQSQPVYQSQFWNALTQDDVVPKKEEIDAGVEADDFGPTEPRDFGSGLGSSTGPSFEDYYSEVRMRYVMGIQLMIQLQCEALVEKFGASPLVCGLAGTIWMRFVARSRVFDDGWADDAIHESEIQKPGEPEYFTPRSQYSAEPHNLHGQRAVMVWHRSLRNSIPLSCSLVISFLACHIAREAILPTDILKWSLEGKLPYLAAFVDIEKCMGKSSSACPLSSSVMFKPSQAVPLQKLESMAASVAQSIGLDLPPVNFYAIASRYLKQLPLPVTKILPHACCIYEWSMPPDLWLSANEFRLPTRVCVMSILIVAIRILYNIHGFGEWERSLSTPRGSSTSSNQIGKLEPTCSSKSGDDAKQDDGSPSHDLDESDTRPVRNSSHVQKSELNAAELLHNLEAKFNEIEIGDTYEYAKDLPTYLQFCKDVVFAGLEPSFENHEEEKIIEQLWEFYQNQNQKDFEPLEDSGAACNNSVLNQKRPRDEGCTTSSSKVNKKIRDEGCISSPSSDNQGPNSAPNCQASVETLKDKAIRQMKSDMEEKRFCYIPPRVNVKRFDYLHYVRKEDEGALIYVAHADYYILLRACARVAQVDIRTMHVGVMSLERRLAWVEKRIDYCLHLAPPDVSCEFCTDVIPQHADDDAIGFSRLNVT